MNQPQQPKQADTSRRKTTKLKSSSVEAAGSDGSALDQAQQWLTQTSMMGMLSRLPQSVKDASTKATTGFNKLSTTQKVVGGLLLAAGVTYLVRGSKSQATTDSQATSESGDTTKTSADTLHELLLFVNDRIEGYQRAVEESKDAQLRGYYKQLVSQSQRFANELNDHLRQQGEERETSTTLKGKFYRGWMDTKAAITGSDEKAILGSNIYGEEWALKAYKEALNDHTLTGSLRLEVERQYAQSQKTYKELKKQEAKH